MKKLIYFLFLFAFLKTYSQAPSFGPEKAVTINGLTFDAMEPFLSNDGNYLFFNNLNDGITTKLFYATRVNDSTFTYVGELNGTNQITTPYLDAVADLDVLGSFYWTSTRNYPTEFDNLHHGTFNAGNVTNIGRVRGNFYIYSPGWLIMDHGISNDGQFLYYNNARFNGSACQGPCETKLGIAQKVNDSTFNVIPNSTGILENINDTNFIYYAPCITNDNLELYYTRFLKGTITASTIVEVCVANRNTATDTFSTPTVLFSETVLNIVEAPTLTADKQIMYYHKKVASTHEIKMRHRIIPLAIHSPDVDKKKLSVYPNPASNQLTIVNDGLDVNTINIHSVTGKLVMSLKQNTHTINIADLPGGIYFIQIFTDEQVVIKKFIKR